MKITHFFGGGVYVKQTEFLAGESGEKHIHEYNHLSTLVSGQVKLVVDGVSILKTAPEVITIEAGKSHQVIALTDTVWHCTHATDCTDPDEVDGVLTGA
jgi:quercetin dioxygenase-like cupin family protein